MLEKYAHICSMYADQAGSDQKIQHFAGLWLAERQWRHWHTSVWSGLLGHEYCEYAKLFVSNTAMLLLEEDCDHMLGLSCSCGGRERKKERGKTPTAYTHTHTLFWNPLRPCTPQSRPRTPRVGRDYSFSFLCMLPERFENRTLAWESYSDRAGAQGRTSHTSDFKNSVKSLAEVQTVTCFQVIHRTITHHYSLLLKRSLLLGWRTPQRSVSFLWLKN